MYVRVKREKLVSLLLTPPAVKCGWLALDTSMPVMLTLQASPHCCCCPTPQTVFLHVDPTDTVTMLKQKLQELLQKVGWAGRRRRTGVAHVSARAQHFARTGRAAVD